MLRDGHLSRVGVRTALIAGATVGILTAGVGTAVAQSN